MAEQDPNLDLVFQALSGLRWLARPATGSAQCRLCQVVSCEGPALSARLRRDNGPKHADACASFDAVAGGTLVTTAMIRVTAAPFRPARGFGAVALELQTLGKRADFVGAP